MNQLDNLRKVIKGRSVAILLPGPSIKQLEERITELKGADICYTSVNDFWIMEKILSKINKQLDIIMCSAMELNVPEQVHIDFLNRGGNILITEEVSIHNPCVDLLAFRKDYKDQIFYFVADRTTAALTRPNIDYPTNFLAQASFSVLVCLSLIGGAKSVYLFGADGGRVGNDLYYGNWRTNNAAEFRLNYDTLTFNATMSQILRNVYTLYNLDQGHPIPVRNVSPETKYLVFPTRTYEEAIDELRATN